MTAVRLARPRFVASPLQATALLVRLRVQQLLNRSWRGGPKHGQRPGTVRRLLVAAGLAYLIFILFLLCQGAVGRLARDYPGHATEALTIQAALLVVTAILASVASRGLGSAAELESLMALPLGTPSIVAAKLAERAIANPFALLLLWPLVSALVSHSGRAPSAALATGFISAILLSFTVAGLWTLTDTLAFSGGPSATARSFRVFFAVASTFGFAASVRFSRMLADTGWMVTLGRILRWTPPGLAVRAAMTSDSARTVELLLLVAAQGLAIAGLTLAVASRGSDHGTLAASPRTGRRRLPVGAHLVSFRLAHPFVDRNVRTLVRDHALLVRMLLLPILVLAFRKWSGAAAQEPATAARQASALAFGIGVYVLSVTGLESISQEGRGLWLLYTLPTPLPQILRQKIIFSLAPAMVFAVGVLLTTAHSTAPFWEYATRTGGIFFGLVCYAVVAVSLGLRSIEPKDDSARPISRGLVWALLLLAAPYGAILSLGSTGTILKAAVLAAFVALAAGQRALDRMPYLLDPTTEARPLPSVREGLVAVFLFSTIQSLCMSYFEMGDAPTNHTWARFIAGTIGFAVAWNSHRILSVGIRRAESPPIWARQVGINRPTHALAVGIAAAALGLGYGVLLRRLGYTPLIGLTPASAWRLAIDAVPVPFIEEMIFRGMVFVGLRRTLGPGQAIVASAILFAVMHPIPAMPAVFLVGVAAAFYVDRCGILLPGMIIHSLYNVGVFFSNGL